MQDVETLKYYDSIDRVTLFSFRKTIETGDFRYMLILNNYDTLPEYSDIEALSVSFFSVYTEYTKAIGDSSGDLEFIEMRRLEVKRDQIFILQSLYDFLCVSPEPEIAELITKQGYTFDLTNQVTYEQSLKRLRGEIEKKKAHYDMTMNKRPDQPEAPNMDSLITEMEKFQGYGFDERSMTLKKFASIVSRYKSYVKRN